MKTDALIDLLATGAGPVQSYPVARRFAVALAIGTAGGFAILLWLFGLNPALRDFLGLPAFWVKITFAGVLTLSGLLASARLARPDGAVGNSKWFAAISVAAMWMLALVVLINADTGTRAQLMLGHSWSVCPFRIALLSAPMLAAGIWAVQGLAPTNQRLAGAAVGLFSGALGASIYCLHCPELAPPFLAIWYVIGMLIPSIVGWAIGRSLLRW
jgi:hypothetical protein